MSTLRELEDALENIEDTDSPEWKRINEEINALVEKRERKIKESHKAKEEAVKAAAIEKALELTEAMVEKMFEDTCLKYQDVNGISFRAWYNQSLTYYSIDSKFNVISRAKSPNVPPRIFENISYAQAQLCILNLIKYKFYDHAVKGHDFAWEEK